MAPKKWNGYSVFVEEMCRKAGGNFRRTDLSITALHTDWEVKKRYKIAAEQRNSARRMKAAISSGSIPSGVVPAGKRHFAENYEQEMHEAMMDYGPDSGFSSSGSPPASVASEPQSKKFFIGDDDGESFIDTGSTCHSPEMEQLEYPGTTEVELFKNACDYYENLEGITHQHVFVVCCSPVVSAQGYKKAAVRAVNRPVEVGMAVFSLANGLEEWISHHFVDPGSLPVVRDVDLHECGCGVHGIHLPVSFQGDCNEFQRNEFELKSDYYAEYKSMLAMIGFDGTNADALPPLFSTSARVAVDEACYRRFVTQANALAKEHGVPVLPRLSFSTLEHLSRLAVYLHAKEQPASVISFSKSFIAGVFNKNCNGYKQFPGLKCDFHEFYSSSTKVCALGAARETSYVMLMILKDCFGFQKNTRFVFLSGKGGIPAEEVEEEEQSDGEEQYNLYGKY